MKGKHLPPGVAYLGIPNILTAKSDSSLNPADISKAWSCIAANVVKKAANEYVTHLKSGKTKNEALERTSQSRFIAAKVHTSGSIFAKFKESVEEMENCDETQVLKTLCTLYGLWQIEELQGYFLKCKQSLYRIRPTYLTLRSDGYFTSEQIDRIQERVDDLCAEVRKYAGESFKEQLPHQIDV